MSKQFFNVHEWEREKCDELVNFERDRISREEGVKEGLEQGIEQGIKQGFQNGVEQTIINMIKAKMSLEDIANVTGKSVKEINKLQENMK